MMYEYSRLTGPIYQMEDLLNQWGKAGWRIIHIEVHDTEWMAVMERSVEFGS